ncbi:MAG: type II toxin-antitoxin system RelE/ParE family toxin [Gammaproteobacteria bacterium]|jgi:mRNA interferase RelE/StbE|nr:type II toxin-antitoxin system RelE/ParE family toxin [Gammaproteobacteria bacterium]
MAFYELKWKPSARRELRTLPQPVIASLMILIDGLKENPYPQGAKKMTAMQDAWRIRQGDYRVVYKVIGNILTVEIIRVGHRRDVYQA